MVLVRSRIAIVAVVAACGAELTGGTPSPGATVDAPGGALADARVDGSIATPDGPASTVDASPDATSPCVSNGRVVYLNFDGVMLTDGAASDATQNRASWIIDGLGTRTAPPYKLGDPNRTAEMTVITAGVTQLLSTFPITVTRTRPAAGPYVMIVFGGTKTQVGSLYTFAVNTLDCPDAVASDVAWISESTVGTQRMINYAVGAIGFGLGLTATGDPTDCLCSWGNDCSPDVTGPCRLTDGIVRTPAINGLNCPAAPAGQMQYETQTFRTAFCQ